MKPVRHMIISEHMQSSIHLFEIPLIRLSGYTFHVKDLATVGIGALHHVTGAMYNRQHDRVYLEMVLMTYNRTTTVAFLFLVLRRCKSWL